MNNSEQHVPENTLEILARQFFRESIEYGFKKVDYIRFVNILLDLSMENQEETNKNIKVIRKHHNPVSRKLPLKGERIWIRNPDLEKDSPLLHKWLSDPYGRYFLLSRTTATTISFEKLIEDKSNIIGLIIFPDGTPVGAIAYLTNNFNQHKAELRKLIGDPSMRGLGLAKEATQLWIQYGLSVLKLKKIYVNTLNTNIRNIRLNEELGFKIEGILRNEVCIDGQYKDVLRMGLWNAK